MVFENCGEQILRKKSLPLTTLPSERILITGKSTGEKDMSGYCYEIKDFSLDNEELLLQETLFHNANGYLGVRGNFEEGYAEGYRSVRGTYLNGFYDTAGMKQAEKLYGLVEEKQMMPNVADTQKVQVVVDGERFSLFEGTVLKKDRALLLDEGVTVRDVVWRSPKGREIQIKIKRMASFEVLPLFLTEYEVTPLNFNGAVMIISGHNGVVKNFCDPADPRVSAEAQQHLYVTEQKCEGDMTYVAARTVHTDLEVCSGTTHVVEMDGEVEVTAAPSETENRIKICVEGSAGNTFHLYKYAVFCDSLRYENPKESVLTILKQVKEKGADALYEAQREYVQRFWKNSCLEIAGDEDLNLAVHYNMYQLLQSAGKDRYANIAAKGLSGEGYEGHYFWDTEMYLQPFFILTNREIARNLIRNRYGMLKESKENARLLGHKKGALYSWRTINGKECSGYFPAGTAQYHISGDVAYSSIAYYLATKDWAFMEECGAEIVIETARLWLDVGNVWNGKFCIQDVTGPDEYTCIVNNNYYTNALAQYNLKWAAKFGKKLLQCNEKQAKKIGLDVVELEEFEWAAEHMYLPYDEKLGINPQDDSFLQKKIWYAADVREEEKPLLLHYHPLHLYRHQICKQADTVLAHFLFEDIEPREVIERTFAYYEKITTHDSSLSTCIFSIVASFLGLEEKAFAYFGESAKIDLFNTHKNTKDGIHTANMGGTYMAVIYGFAGLRIKESGLYLNPVLPEKWTGYRFRILYEDARIEVAVSKKGCKITRLEGSGKNIRVYGQRYVLQDILEIEREK